MQKKKKKKKNESSRRAPVTKHTNMLMARLTKQEFEANLTEKCTHNI